MEAAIDMGGSAQASSAPAQAPGTGSASVETTGSQNTQTNFAPPQTSSQPTSASANVASDWTQGLSPDLKNYVDTKGFKDPTSVLESYVNLEKLRGVPQDRLLKLPETADAPEWNDIYTKLGKPLNPEGYGLEAPEGADPAFNEWAKNTFHKLNLTEGQGQQLAKAFNDFAAGIEVDSSESYKTEVAKQEIALKKEWGSAYHQNIATAQRAAQTFGVPGEAIDAMEKAIGFDGVMKLLSNIGSKVGEANFNTGNQMQGFGENILTPEQAQAKIKALKNDRTFVEKYTAGDAEARDKMSRLHQMAHPTD